MKEKSRKVTILCRCGAQPIVPGRFIGQPQACGICGIAFRVDRNPDGTSKVTFLQAPPAPTPSAEAQRCACGAPLVVKPEHTGKDVKCPSCKRTLRFEKVRDPQSMSTVIRRVEAGTKAAEPEAPKAAAGAPSQPLLCVCGQQLFVQGEHLGKQAQCPSCGTIMVLERSRDPQTMATVVRARVVGKAPPPDLDAWSLKDFE